MTRLMVGCPVRDRGWILKTWFDYVDEAAKVAGVKPEFVFIAGESFDNTDRIMRYKRRSRIMHVQHISEEPSLPEGRNRSWTVERLEFMVRARNELLDLVRDHQPDLFLSLDSDILIHPECIKNLLETIERYDAVGGRTYLDTVEKVMNYGNFIPPDPRMNRGQDAEGVLPVQIIMAIKMMSPQAYHVDYEYHFGGEDLGWSWACHQAGLKFALDGRVVNKHCLKPEMIDKPDPRVGY